MKKQILTNKVLNLPDCEMPASQDDFRDSIHWKIFRIMAEFVDGFQFLGDLKKAVTIFGASSSSIEKRYYEEAKKLASLCVKNKFDIITGGGPGIMEAANCGAANAGGDSIGFNIQLPSGQRMNEFVEKPIGFHYFFTRKVMFSFASQIYVYFPGGFGTLDEFFEMVTLIQTKKISKKVLVIAVGKDYWKPLFDWIKSDVYGKNKAIKKEDMNIYNLVDTAEEAFKLIKSSKF